MNSTDKDRRDAACRIACEGIETAVLEVTHGLNELYDDLLSQREALLMALETCRGQWIHSVNADLCIAAIAKAGGRESMLNIPTFNGISARIDVAGPNKEETILLQDLAIQNMTAKFSEISRCAYELGVQLYALVDSFDAEDQEAITLQLRKMSENRKSVKKAEVH